VVVGCHSEETRHCETASKQVEAIPNKRLLRRPYGPPRNDKRGSLLFETFVALMILSIGITGTLRVFGQALFVSSRNAETVQIRKVVTGILFDWFVMPSADAWAQDGSLKINTGGDASQSELEVQVRSETLTVDTAATVEEEGEEETGTSAAAYRVKLHLLKDRGEPIYQFETVMFSTGEGA